MSLAITPSAQLDDMVKGEEVSFSLDITRELAGNTVKSHIFEVHDSLGLDVSSDFSGGSSISIGILTFGVIAHSLGTFTLKFWVTCSEFLPNGTTPYEFVAIMTVNIKKK